MKNITEIHEEAMELADQAYMARHQKDFERANKLAYQAYKLEVCAAQMLENETSAEPTRSILYRSAASLALECGELDEAISLIRTALAGNPPEEIVDELRNLQDEITIA